MYVVKCLLESVDEGDQREDYKAFIERAKAEEYFERLVRARDLRRQIPIHGLTGHFDVLDYLIQWIDADGPLEAVRLVREGKGLPLPPKPGEPDLDSF